MTPQARPPKPRHIPIRQDWLDLRTEAVIDPEVPIVDAHHHLWDKAGNRYLLDEMLGDATGHNLVATVFAEGKEGYRTDGPEELRSLGETEMVAAIAEASVARGEGCPQVGAAIVGYADLGRGRAVGVILDAHVEAGCGRFRGVRNSSAWHADPEARGSVLVQPPGMLYHPTWRAGLAEVERRGLVFDAWLYHTQLIDLIDLAREFPRLPIVINHLGGPIGIGPYEGRRAEVFADWSYLLRRLSAFDNVSIKLGGFGMLMAGFDFHERPLPPSSEELAEAWGPYTARRDRDVRVGARDVRKQFSGGQGYGFLSGRLECIQEDRRILASRRKGRRFPWNGVADLQLDADVRTGKLPGRQNGKPNQCRA